MHTSLASTRPPRTGPTPGHILAQLAVNAALDKQARDVTVMDLRGISGEVDFFVICTGDVAQQMKAIVESVVEYLKEEADERPSFQEGQAGQSGWIVLDYFDLVVHVFNPATREKYDLERLWGDAPTEVLTNEASGSVLLEQVEKTQETAEAEP